MANYSEEKGRSDASDHNCTRCIARLRKEDADKPLTGMLIEPMLYFPGAFSKAQVRWQISSKELYPLIYISERITLKLERHPRPLIFWQYAGTPLERTIH